MDDRFKHLSVIAVIVIVACVIIMQLKKDKDVTDPAAEQTVAEQTKARTPGTPGTAATHAKPAAKSTDVNKKMFPKSKVEKPSNFKDPRALTAEEKAENKREIARMRKALPGNIWLPTDEFSQEDSDKQKEWLRKTLTIESKILNKTATKEEQKDYYTYQLKSSKDKIDIIKYYQARTAELSKKKGTEYLDDADIEAGNETIVAIEKEIAEHSKKLAEL